MIDISPGNFGGAIGGVNFLNNHGQAVGSGATANEAGSHAFLWSQGKLTDLTELGTLGSVNGALNVNELGHVVGISSTTPPTFLAVLWRNGEFINLSSLTADGDDCSSPARINSRDQIVGNSYSCTTGEGHAFLWENGEMVNLNSLIPSTSGLELIGAGWINESGVIAAQAMLTAGVNSGGQRAVLLFPDGKYQGDGGVASSSGADHAAISR
jgi:probable HAF family extracellular repeat protein